MKHFFVYKTSRSYQLMLLAGLTMAMAMGCSEDKYLDSSFDKSDSLAFFNDTDPRAYCLESAEQFLNNPIIMELEAKHQCAGSIQREAGVCISDPVDRCVEALMKELEDDDPVKVNSTRLGRCADKLMACDATISQIEECFNSALGFLIDESNTSSVCDVIAKNDENKKLAWDRSECLVLPPDCRDGIGSIL